MNKQIFWSRVRLLQRQRIPKISHGSSPTTLETEQDCGERLWDQPELPTYLNKPKWEEFPRNYSILIKSFEKYLNMVSIYLFFVCATLGMPEESRKGSQITAAAVTGGGWRPNVSPARTANNLNCWSISPGPEISLEKDFDLPLLKI